jgi:hypothetical protein
MPGIVTLSDVEAFVNGVGECMVYPCPGHEDITSLLEGNDLQERRQRALRWAEELHLAKKAFLSVAVEQELTLTSWRRFIQVYARRSNQSLNLDEDGLLEVIRREGGGSSRRLMQMGGMPARRFNAALLGLRMKMLVAFCGKTFDEDGRQMDCFMHTDTWLPDEFGI